jgi:hypothetical protein
MSLDERKRTAERMKNNNPMKNPLISKKVRDSNIKNGGYLINKIRMTGKTNPMKKEEIKIKALKNRPKHFKVSQDIKRIIEMYKQPDITVKKLSEVLHYSERTISKILRENRIYPKLKKYPTKARKRYCFECNKRLYPYNHGQSSGLCKECFNHRKKNKSYKLLRHSLKFIFDNKPITPKRNKKGSIEYLEHLKKIGFKKGHKPSKHNGRKFTKGHKINVGRYVPLSSRIKMSATMQGIPLDKWEKFTHIEKYGFQFTKYLKEEIKKRDDYLCQYCGLKKKLLHIHHIDYNKLNNNPINLICLCVNCHMSTNYNRQKWKDFFNILMFKKLGFYINEDVEVDK